MFAWTQEQHRYRRAGFLGRVVLFIYLFIEVKELIAYIITIHIQLILTDIRFIPCSRKLKLRNSTMAVL